VSETYALSANVGNKLAWRLGFNRSALLFAATVHQGKGEV